jgi:hypothetical protein
LLACGRSPKVCRVTVRDCRVGLTYGEVVVFSYGENVFVGLISLVPRVCPESVCDVLNWVFVVYVLALLSDAKPRRGVSSSSLSETVAACRRGLGDFVLCEFLGLRIEAMEYAMVRAIVRGGDVVDYGVLIFLHTAVAVAISWNDPYFQVSLPLPNECRWS